MSEMSPLLRIIVGLTRLTIMVIATLLVLVAGLLIGFHCDGFSTADWTVLIILLVLAALAMLLARGLGRELKAPNRD